MTALGWTGTGRRLSGLRDLFQSLGGERKAGKPVALSLPDLGARSSDDVRMAQRHRLSTALLIVGALLLVVALILAIV